MAKPKVTGLKNLNPRGSEYAQRHGRQETEKVEKLVRRGIFDAAPKQFFDLTLTGMKTSKEKITSDEFEYDEMGYQRSPLITTSSYAGGGQEATISVADVAHADSNNFFNLADGTPILCVKVDEENSTVTFRAHEGTTLPAIPSGLVMPSMGPIDADGSDTIAKYFRGSYFTRTNYVQFFSTGRIYGRIEMMKLKANGRQKLFLQKELETLMSNHRIEMQNTIWLGKKGEVITREGLVAKTMGGIIPTMREAGSPEVRCVVANMAPALEKLAEMTEFGNIGERRFLFGTTTAIRKISQYYKEEKTRYTPDNKIANLMLEGVNIGSSFIVFVPFNRLKDTASFPASYQKMLFLIDWENIDFYEMEAPSIIDGFNDERGKGGKSNKTELGVFSNMTMAFNNPLSSGIMVVEDL